MKQLCHEQQIAEIFFCLIFFCNYFIPAPVSVACGGTGVTGFSVSGVLCYSPDQDAMYILQTDQSGAVLSSGQDGYNPVFIQPSVGPGLNVKSDQTMFYHELIVPVGSRTWWHWCNRV